MVHAEAESRSWRPASARASATLLRIVEHGEHCVGRFVLAADLRSSPDEQPGNFRMIRPRAVAVQRSVTTPAEWCAAVHRIARLDEGAAARIV